MIGVGFSITCMHICREETIWVSPFVLSAIAITILFIVLDKDCLEKTKKLLLYLIPISIFVIIIFVICLFNYIAYGLFTLNQYSGKVWNNVMGAITSVKVEKEYDSVPVSKEAMQKLYEVSPAFNELKEYFETPQDVNWYAYGQVEGEIEEGWFSWAFIAAVDYAGYCTDAKTANNFYKKITDEVNKAYEDGRLEKKENKRTFFDFNKTDELLKNLKLAYIYQINMNGCEMRAPIDQGTDTLVDEEAIGFILEQIDKFKEITGNNSTNSKTYNYWVDRVKINSLENITKVYAKISPYLFKIAILTYILGFIIFFRKSTRFSNFKEMTLLTGMLILYILRLLVISYTETAKFKGAISTMYLASTYSMQFAFEILSVWFLINSLKKKRSIKKED